MDAQALDSQAETPDDADLDALAARLAAVLGRSRAQGIFNVEQFLFAVEHDMGGSLVIESPSRRKRRGRVEVRYASEGFQLSSSIAQIGFED